MKKLLKLLGWIDNNIVHILLTGLILIVPLYPKIPFRMVSYTYISIRLEDLYVAGLIIVYCIQLFRRKLQINKTFLILFGLFWISAFLSFLYGFYVLKSMYVFHLGFLNAFRRVEYMSVFFVALSVIKTKKNFYYYLYVNMFVIFLVLVYALGQKFIGWPAVQTMNPEYAKGYLLYLTPDARVSSTFSGHYDLAAYLVFFMPIILSLYFVKKHIGYLFLFTLAVMIVVLTASRISFGAYLISVVPFLIFLKKPKVLLFVLIVTAAFTLTSKSLTTRFSRTFQVKQLFVNQNTGQVEVPQAVGSKELPAGTFYMAINNKVTDANTILNEKLVYDKLLSDIVYNASKSGRDLSASNAALLAASISGRLKPVNTVVSDISFATRLQVEWPRAIKAFLRFPPLGSGPSSITEATDNDYLRAIGEFGILGTGFFVFILFLIVKKLLNAAKKSNQNMKYLYFGFLFGLGGLLFNAGYIDVFEASKVAFIFWTVSGMYIASISLKK